MPACLGLLLTSLLVASAQAAPGDLDHGFGSGGRVVTELPATRFADLTIQADGKIVVVGATASDTVVVRYLTDGTLDPSFGTGGSLTLQSVVSPKVASHLGGLVVAGVPPSPPRAFVLLRLLADGTLDPDFGTAGVVTESTITALPPGGGGFIFPTPSICGVMVADDGDVVVGLGLDFTAAGGSKGMGAVRYDATGTSDPAFVGESTTIVLSIAPLRFGVGLVAAAGPCSDVDLDGAGGIVFSGTEQRPGPPTLYGEIAFGARLLATSGQRDPAFGTNGTVYRAPSFPPHTFGDAVAGDGTGRTLLSVSGIGIGLLRLLPDGTNDPSFALAPAYDDLAVDGAGRILGLLNYFGMDRLLADGAPDPDFGTDGRTTTSFAGWPSTQAIILAEDPDGSILVGGRLQETPTTDGGFALARFEGNPSSAGPLAGKSLVLTSSDNPNARRLTLVSVDPGLGLGDGADSGDDPRLAGATLRVHSDAGAPFDATYDMPASAWSTIVKNGTVVGWDYRGESGVVQRVTLLAGKRLKITARGGELAHALTSNPDPVGVTLSLGDHASCLEFGGDVRFRPGRSYKAKLAPAPAACP